MVNFEKLESLVKIKLTEEEKTAAVEFFNLWLENFEKLDKLENADTENTEPLISVSSLENVMREDVPCKLFDRETLLASAPERRDGYIVIPKVIE